MAGIKYGILRFFSRIGSAGTIFVLTEATLLVFDTVALFFFSEIGRFGMPFAICLLLASTFDFPENIGKNVVASVSAAMIETFLFFSVTDPSAMGKAMESVWAFALASAVYLFIGVPMMRWALDRYGKKPVRQPAYRSIYLD